MDGTGLRKWRSKRRETYVITNNHFRGQAVVNAIEIKAALEEERVSGSRAVVQGLSAVE